MSNNILITSAGKRVTLVRLFQKELKKDFPSANVYVTDMNPSMSAAAMVSDGHFEVPSVKEQGYIECLLEICIKNNIRLIIPTIDTELLVLAENKMLFRNHGIEPVVSDLSFVIRCRDKRKTNILFDNLRIRVPSVVDKYNPVFPLFAKPFDGSLSKDLYIIQNSAELTLDILEHPKLMFMEYIDKNVYNEYTVDMYYGVDNKLKCVIPRERIEVRAGEINKGITRKNYLVNFLKERMEYMSGVVGCICIQLFYNPENDDVVGIEINPRFGGGYPLSYYAGGNYPGFLVTEYLLNESIAYSDKWLDGTLMLRYDDDVIIYSE